MAIKFEKLEVGKVYYDRHKTRMGNTTFMSIAEWPVKILEVNPDHRYAYVSWNGNPRQLWSERQLCKLFDWSMEDDCAEVKRGAMGRVISVKKKKVDNE